MHLLVRCPQVHLTIMNSSSNALTAFHRPSVDLFSVSRKIPGL
jgi:hypothetical protein